VSYRRRHHPCEILENIHERGLQTKVPNIVVHQEGVIEFVDGVFVALLGVPEELALTGGIQLHVNHQRGFG